MTYILIFSQQYGNACHFKDKIQDSYLVLLQFLVVCEDKSHLWDPKNHIPKFLFVDLKAHGEGFHFPKQILLLTKSHTGIALYQTAGKIFLGIV